MRIWMLTSEIPDEAGGDIAKYLDNYTKILGTAGHEVVIIAWNNQACNKQIAPGVRLINVVPRALHLGEQNPTHEMYTHPAYPYNVLSYWPAFCYQMAEEVVALLKQLPPPDIIESQERTALPYFLIQRKLTEQTLLKQIPILVHLHGAEFHQALANQEPRYRFPKYWTGQMEKFCIVAADSLLSPSHFLADYVEQAMQRSLNIAKIPYPYATNLNTAPGNGQTRNIVYAGPLQVLKGVLPLLRACNRLWVAGEDFQLSLIGDDMHFYPKATTVGAFIRHRYTRWINSGQLKLIEQWDQTTVLEQIQQAWAVVIPGLQENFPYTCIEAMAMGQVILASQTGGQTEIIESDGVNGFLFDWNTPDDFEKKLTQVLKLNSKERLKITQNAQTCIRNLCAPEVILPQRLQHYETVIERYQPRRLFPTVSNKVKEHIDYTEPQILTRENDEQAGQLSVIVPYYNVGIYLDDTLESIFKSTYSPYEIIIVDDCSTDPHGLEILEEVKNRRLPNVRVLHQPENLGLAFTRNTGAQAAHGEFIAFVDADDMIEPDFFERAIDVLQNYPNVDFVYSWLRTIGDASIVWPTWNAEFPYLLGYNMISVLGVLRRASFLKAGQNRLDYNIEDYEGWIGQVEAGHVGVSLPALLVRYRIRSGSIWKSANNDQLLYLYDLITQYHSEAYRDWAVELFNLQNANGPARTWSQPAREMIDNWTHQQDNNNQLETRNFIYHLSGEDIARQIPIRKIIKAVGFKIATYPGFRWLYRFRSLGKKVLGP